MYALAATIGWEGESLDAGEASAAVNPWGSLMKAPFTKARLEHLALAAEIAGALGVVVSVIYLARQISDNNKLLRSEAHYNALSLGQRPLEMIVENDGLASAVTRCDANPAGVDAATWQRCTNFYLMQLNSWEYFYYQNADGSIPRQLWTGADAYFKTLVRTRPGYARFWNEMEETFDEPFRSYVIEIIGRSAPLGKPRP